MSTPNFKRLARAFHREGYHLEREGDLWRIGLTDRPHIPMAEVLLHADLSLDLKAVKQLMGLMRLQHPDGSRVCRACATPDFHPGSHVPIGSVVSTTDLVIPKAVGGDINCGMRMHKVGLTLDELAPHLDYLKHSLKGDYLLGTQELAYDLGALQAMFTEGLSGWIAETRRRPHAKWRYVDCAQMESELDRVHLGGSVRRGDMRHLPDGLFDPQLKVHRGGDLGSIGGGNHFVELQVVEEVYDRKLAWSWAGGLKQGDVVFMIHSGSRGIGQSIGKAWRAKAQRCWPTEAPHPEGQLFPFTLESHLDLVDEYLEAEATAAHYGWVNRQVLAEVMRLRLREVTSTDLEVPLIYDLPHNLTFSEGEAWVIRKGACPAHLGQPVIIPGSMGADSFLLVGLGSDRFLSSASHGAGRALSRFESSRESSKGASPHERPVDCITLNPERLREEAPRAYKPIHAVIDVQERHALTRRVARMSPLLTFKA